jgi:catechol-2,3-dioxygenase
MPVVRLNHAVLFVRDLERAGAFYREVLGMEEVARWGGMLFLRLPGSPNHHDLGLAEVGANALAPPRGAVGLYHLAWEVADPGDLLEMYQRLLARGALVGASDHGATKSLYGVDPDGNQFEVLWMLPREEWGPYERAVTTHPLDLEALAAAAGHRGPGSGGGGLV